MSPVTSSDENKPWTKPAVRNVQGTAVARPKRDAQVQAYIPAWIRGTGLTMKHFFTNVKDRILGDKLDPVIESLESGITTIEYPEEKRIYPERFRGLHRLTTRADDSPRCVACLCCSTACPAQCIHIVPGEYPIDDPRRGYERYPTSFVIDELRCVFCGFCVQACPCDAIRMDTGSHPTAYDSRDQFLYNKEILLELTAQDGSRASDNTRHEPGDPTHPGLSRDQGH